ncbi:MAG: PKD domain-containing protein, partial [Petrotogales bacterium]
IPVEDARYFMDGWGIIEGDQLQIEGQTKTAKIINVNYDRNVITVNTDLNWYSGNGISMAYSGLTPDIGAYECTSTDPLTATIDASPTSGEIPLTVNFKGIIGGGTSPYSYSWQFGDGDSSSSQNPSHTYSEEGTYNITLTVTDSQNNHASDSLSVKANKNSTFHLTIASVTGSPSPGEGGTTNPEPGDHSFTSGSNVQVKSIPNSNYRFSLWTGDVDNTQKYDKEITFTMDQDKSTSAHFCTKCGDANGDLSITPADAQVAFDLYLARISNPTECEKENADVNCDGTITPSDAQGIFDKYLGKESLPCDCSSQSRNASVLSQTREVTNVKIIMDNFQVRSNEVISVPIIIDSSYNIKSFGFDLIFPSETLEFVCIDRIKSNEDFNQLAAHKITKGVLRIGGYKITSSMNNYPNVLIILVFNIIGEEKKPNVFTITNTVDDISNAVIKYRYITDKS